MTSGAVDGSGGGAVADAPSSEAMMRDAVENEVEGSQAMNVG